MRHLKLYLLLISLINLSCGQSQPYYSNNEYFNLSSFNLKGKVKQIKETSFAGEKQGDIFTTLTPAWQHAWQNDKLLKFDLNGNLTDQIYFDGNTELRKDIYKFDNNRIVEVKAKYVDRLYEYNGTGQILKQRVIDKQPARITSGNKSDIIERTSIRYYEYDKIGKLKKVYEKDLNGHQLSYELYSYNSNGLLTKKEIKYPKFTESYTYKYNNQNLPIETIWRDTEDGMLERKIFKYHNGVLIELRWENFDDNELEGYIVYTFENGNEKQIFEYDDENRIESEEINYYDYDIHGNWTRKTIISNNDKIFIVNREIEYY
jgi:hypothetical protein